MERAEKTNLTVMCMVYDNNDNVLVQERVDPKWSGIAFPGGHVEAGEAFVDAAVREVFEDSITEQFFHKKNGEWIEVLK